MMRPNLNTTTKFAMFATIAAVAAVMIAATTVSNAPAYAKKVNVNIINKSFNTDNDLKQTSTAANVAGKVSGDNQQAAVSTNQANQGGAFSDQANLASTSISQTQK